MKPLTAASLVALLASCQSLAEGIVGLEGRAIVLDDQTADTPFAGVGPDDVEVDGYGVHVSIATPIVDVLGGVDFREFEGEDATEVTVGARRRFFELSRIHPYLEANLRYAIDELDVGPTDEDYFGWNAGGGMLLDLTSSLFLNVRVAYETTDVDGNDVDGLLGTVGLGIHL